MAFGTGEHPTTAMCLDLAGEHNRCRGCGLLDYGCGSGLLAIAAVALGAAFESCAVDIDPQALAGEPRQNADAIINALKQLLIVKPDAVPADEAV